MPKIEKLVRYMTPEGVEVPAMIVALSKDCKMQVDDKCTLCGHDLPRKLVPLHVDADGNELTDDNLVELNQLELTITRDEKGNPVPGRVGVCGRRRVPRAATRADRKPHTWWPDEEA